MAWHQILLLLLLLSCLLCRGSSCRETKMTKKKTTNSERKMSLSHHLLPKKDGTGRRHGAWPQKEKRRTRTRMTSPQTQRENPACLPSPYASGRAQTASCWERCLGKTALPWEQLEPPGASDHWNTRRKESSSQNKGGEQHDDAAAIDAAAAAVIAACAYMHACKRVLPFLPFLLLFCPGRIS